MSRAVIVVFVVLNLALMGYSGYFYMCRVGFSWTDWLRRDVTVVPFLIFTVAVVSRKVFILNASIPFLVYYGFVFQLKARLASDFLIPQLPILLLILDVVYAVAVNITLKAYWQIVVGLLAGFLLLLIYHRLQFGAAIRLDLPVIKIYEGLVETAEKVF